MAHALEAARKPVAIPRILEFVVASLQGLPEEQALERLVRGVHGDVHLILEGPVNAHSRRIRGMTGGCALYQSLEWMHSTRARLTARQ